MNAISNLINKKPLFKSHIVPSVVSAGVALAIAIPLTTALSGGSSIVAATPVDYSTPPAAANTCSAATPAASTTHAAKPATSTGALTVSHVLAPAVTTGGQNSGNANTTSGSSAANNGNTSTNNGLVGVNANTSVSALNNDLNKNLDNNLNNNTILSGNKINVLNNPLQNSTNTVNLPIVSSVLGTLGIQL